MHTTHVSTEKHRNLSCKIEVFTPEGHYLGTLEYNSTEVGIISGADLNAVRAQFHAICKLVDVGGMIRHGIVMLGYHNRAFQGDVLLVDGEVIGEWNLDDEEWCHFTASGALKATCSAPSPWKLHDAIADWLKRQTP